MLLLAALLLASRVGEAMAEELQPTFTSPILMQTQKHEVKVQSCYEDIVISLVCNSKEKVDTPSTADKTVERDERVEKLRAYFAKHKSPLEPYAYDFVYYADTYNLDWKLVAAISGVESTFGKHIPKNSFNAYGWANGDYRFNSWEDSIEHVSKTLRMKYYDRGLDTVPKIARVYAPPSTTWGGNVTFFMTQIDDYQSDLK